MGDPFIGVIAVATAVFALGILLFYHPRKEGK